MKRALRDEIDAMEAKLRELLAHPEATQADKASLTRAGAILSGIERRHGQHWRPLDPRTLPPGRPLRSVAHGRGWLAEWEDGQEAAHA